jgi:hypothetical protein
MSPAIPCPQGEEFSALLDWELAPERLPLLEKHIEECEKCCAHYLRLAAADRMLGLAIGEVHLLAACLAAAPGEKDPPAPALVAQLEEAGRVERVATLQEIARLKARRRRKLLISAAVVLVLLVGGFFAALQPSPVKALSGGARSEAGYVLARGDGQATLCDGTRVDLAPGTVVGFRATWRWEQPWAELKSGQLTVVEGRLSVQVGGQTREVPTGGSAEASPGGRAP